MIEEQQTKQVSQEKLRYYRFRVNNEAQILLGLMRELNRDGLVWAADQICDIIGSLKEVQIEAEEPSEEDLREINQRTPVSFTVKETDSVKTITFSSGEEYTVVDMDNWAEHSSIRSRTGKEN